MSPAAWTALGGIFTAAVTGYFLWLTSRRSVAATQQAAALTAASEERKSAVEGYDRLTDQLQEERAALQDTVTGLRSATAEAQATANKALAAARRAEQAISDLAHEVEQIVMWIDAGALPPSPAVSPRLRAILARHRHPNGDPLHP